MQAGMTCAALFVFLTFPLRAQRGTEAGLDVEIGDTYEYEGFSRNEADMHDPLTDSIRTVGQESVSLDILKVTDITADEIIWEMSVVASTADSRNSGEGVRQVPIVMTMTTDHQGRVKEISAGGEENGLPGGGELVSMMMNGSNGLSKGPGWFFLPELAARRVGESWSETSNDTMTIAIAAGLELDLYISTSATYTYHGTVDTLGMPAAHVSWVMDKMTLDGAFDMPEADMSFSMSGTGDGTGSAYYSLSDRMLLVQVHDLRMDQNVDLGAMGSQSVRMRMYTEQTRQED